MCGSRVRWWGGVAWACAWCLCANSACAAELTSQNVLRSIESAKRFLVATQNPDGSWSPKGGAGYQAGTTALAVLALINSSPKFEAAGGDADLAAPAIRKGLDYLRKQDIERTYEVALAIMAFADAKDPQDRGRIRRLAAQLERSQITTRQGGADGSGLWSYSTNPRGLLNFAGDRSNGQFAVLGLHAAALAGAPISRSVWEQTHRHWTRYQNADGGWSYGPGGGASTGSMTVAGIATVTITTQMLRDDSDVNPDGTPRCCPEPASDTTLEKAVAWMERHFSVRSNPGNEAWLLYYLYGMERAGRLSGRRFFSQHDWYREGAQYLIDHQSGRGHWSGTGIESDQVIATSFALLFLSKGLAPVLINKLKHGPEDPARPGELASHDWNQHADDVRHLTELISGLPKWPKLVNWQVLDVHKVSDGPAGVQDLLQSPILFLAGRNRPQFADKQLQLLKDYLDQGGFIFAVANCGSSAFEDGLREMVARMFPHGEAELKRLPPDHPVFRSEHLLDDPALELYGVDVGCRTAIIYSPADLSCYWDKWMPFPPENRHKELDRRVIGAMNVGVNVVAYATGREPPSPLDNAVYATAAGAQDQIERGLLQVAKLRHTGNWDAAPQALRNLLLSLNRTVGMAASTRSRSLTASDPNIFKYPLLYMHGRNKFEFSSQELVQLKEYLDRGGVLFADACCGAAAFDRSFREMIGRLYPGRSLERIPPDHEMFTTKVGHDVRRLRRRSVLGGERSAFEMQVREEEVFLEGIPIDGRYAVIYSKYDISCALERQAAATCAGYVDEDALKLAVNIVLYALLQDVRYYDAVR